MKFQSPTASSFPVRAIGMLATMAVLVAAWVASPVAVEAAGAGLCDGSALTFHQGDLIITEDGAVVENLEIHGSLRIRGANNVTVRNVRIYVADYWTVLVESGSASFECMDIGHPSYVGERGIGGDNIVARNLNIHHVEDGIKLGSNTLYEGIHVHDLASLRSDPHADAVQDDGGAQGAVVRNSILDATGPVGYGNAAIQVSSALANSNDVTFTNNYLNGGNYMVFVREGGHGIPSNITIANNRIGPDFRYGILSQDGPVNWYGNVWASTGEPVEAGENEPQGATTTTTSAPSSSTSTSTTAAASPEPSPSPSTSPSTSTSTSTSTSVVAAPPQSESPSEPARDLSSTTEAPIGETFAAAAVPDTTSSSTTAALFAAQGLPLVESTTGTWWQEQPETVVFGGLAVALALMLVLGLLNAIAPWTEQRGFRSPESRFVPIKPWADRGTKRPPEDLR